MPLPVRSVSVRFSVLVFFIVGVVGMISGLSPDTCAWRAGLGAMVAYVVAVIAVRVINTILTQAMVTDWMNEATRETEGDDTA